MVTTTQVLRVVTRVLVPLEGLLPVQVVALIGILVLVLVLRKMVKVMEHRAVVDIYGEQTQPITVVAEVGVTLLVEEFQEARVAVVRAALVSQAHTLQTVLMD